MSAVVEVRSLTKDFGGLQAVDHLSFAVEKGEIFGFLGPNGAGKTTSLRMLTGLLRPTEGSVHYFGQDIGDGLGVVRDHLGVLFQDNVLWPELTAHETLRFLAEMHGAKPGQAKATATELLERLGLSEKAKVMSAQLSGGQRRRLALATALVHDPDILLLDEPEAGLDPQSRVAVREIILQLAQRKTVIITTHNMDEADRLCDRIGIIDHGKLIALGTPKELKATLGKGDALEIEVEGDPSRAAAAVSSLKVGTVQVVAQTLVIHGDDLVKRLPKILAAIKLAGSTTRGSRHRETTLEDAFIHLTGRGLRD